MEAAEHLENSQARKTVEGELAGNGREPGSRGDIDSKVLEKEDCRPWLTDDFTKSIKSFRPRVSDPRSRARAVILTSV